MILDPPTVRHIAALAAVGGVLAAAPAAGAQDTVIVLKGPGARALADQGVRVGAVAPARKRARRITLPLGETTISGATATVRQRGALRLRAGRRSVVLRDLTVTVGRRSTVSARVGGRTRTVAAIDAPAARRSVQPTGTYVTEAPLRLTASTVRLLRRELRRPGLRGGRLGTIDLEAATTPAPSGTEIPGAPDVVTVTGPPTPGGGTVAARPAGAVSITGGTVHWSPRQSWLGYLESGDEPAGAVPPATLADGTYAFPVTGGWYDPATGATVVDTAGGTVFRYPTRFLDMRFANWTWDLASPTPKAVATVERATGVKPGVVGSRQPILLLKPGATRPTVEGSTLTWASVPATLSAEGVPVFRAYLYDTDQGSLTISATLG